MILDAQCYKQMIVQALKKMYQKNCFATEKDEETLE